jgi:hypothetical protein
MPTIDIPLGKTVKIHLKAFGQDNVNNPSQVVDTTTPLVPVNNNPSFATGAVDPNDNRAVILSAIAAGQALVFIDTNPALPTANRLQVVINITTPPPDNRRVDFLSADPPV